MSGRTYYLGTKCASCGTIKTFPPLPSQPPWINIVNAYESVTCLACRKRDVFGEHHQFIERQLQSVNTVAIYIVPNITKA